MLQLTRLTNVPSWFVRVVVLVLLALALAMIFAPQALPAPKAENAMECAMAGDMAVTARAMAEEKIEREVALRVMDRIYDAGSERGVALMRAIVNTAYALKDTSAENFAGELTRHCVRSGGDMDGVLGTDS